MVPAGNKAKSLSSVNHTTKTIHHHHQTGYQKQKYFQTLSHLLSEFFAMKTTGIDNCTYWLVMIDKTYKKHKSCYMGVPRSRI